MLRLRFYRCIKMSPLVPEPTTVDSSIRKSGLGGGIQGQTVVVRVETR